MPITLVDNSTLDYRIESVWFALSLDEETGFEGIMAGARESTDENGMRLQVWHPLLTSNPEIIPEMRKMARDLCDSVRSDKSFHIVRFERVIEQ